MFNILIEVNNNVLLLFLNRLEKKVEKWFLIFDFMLLWASILNLNHWETTEKKFKAFKESFQYVSLIFLHS